MTKFSELKPAPEGTLMSMGTVCGGKTVRETPIKDVFITDDIAAFGYDYIPDVYMIFVHNIQGPAACFTVSKEFLEAETDAVWDLIVSRFNRACGTKLTRK